MADPPTLRELIPAWRARAAELRAWAAAEGAAVALEHAADELAGALRAEADAPLTLGEASRESGYAVETLAKLLREGRIPNAGRKHAPRIRRGDLPLKINSALQARHQTGRVVDARRRMAAAVAHSSNGD